MPMYRKCGAANDCRDFCPYCNCIHGAGYCWEETIGFAFPGEAHLYARLGVNPPPMSFIGEVSLTLSNAGVLNFAGLQKGDRLIRINECQFNCEESGRKIRTLAFDTPGLSIVYGRKEEIFHAIIPHPGFKGEGFDGSVGMRLRQVGFHAEAKIERGDRLLGINGYRFTSRESGLKILNTDFDTSTLKVHYERGGVDYFAEMANPNFKG